MNSEVTLALAFGAGLISFLSPCVLPLVPAYLSYLSGVAISGGKVHWSSEDRWRIFLHALVFVIGFSLVFITLGWSTSYLAWIFMAYGEWISRIGGLLLIVFGLGMLNVIRLPLFEREYRFQLGHRPASYVGSFAVGLVFAAGWTPCIGPILGSILVLASTRPGQGALLLGAYSLGLAIPFLLAVFFVEYLLRLRRYSRLAQQIGGVLLVSIGILLVADLFKVISAWFIQITGFTGI